jgi:uncharacterized protein (TIGR04222 family)
MHREWLATPELWGVGSDDFLGCYLLLTVLLWVAAWLGQHWLAEREARRGGALDQDPYLVAYLNDGPKLAMFAALASLRKAGLVDVRDGFLVRCHPDPPAQAGHHRLERALLDELDQPTTLVRLGLRAPVRGALKEIHTRLRDRNLLAVDTRQRRARLFGLVMAPLVALGVIRLLAEDATGHPLFVTPLSALAREIARGDSQAYLALSILQAVVISVGLWHSGDNLASTARVKLDRLRETYSYLSPGPRPRSSGSQVASSSAPAVRLAVGLFGATAFWAVDPVLAGALDVPHVRGFGISEDIVTAKRSNAGSAA